MLHRGRIATNPEVLETRPLTREDLVLLREPRGPDASRAGSGAVQKLRDPHHRLARLIAAGFRGHELVLRSGYSTQRIHTLQKDPAFIELIAKFREKVDEAYIDEMVSAEFNDRQALAILSRQRLERVIEADEDPENKAIGLRDMNQTIADLQDRFGTPKLKTTLSLNSEFAKTMEEAIARANKVREAKVIDVRPNAPQAQAEQQSPGESNLNPPSPPALIRRV